jgi:hypothetical protein
LRVDWSEVSVMLSGMGVGRCFQFVVRVLGLGICRDQTGDIQTSGQLRSCAFAIPPPHIPILDSWLEKVSSKTGAARVSERVRADGRAGAP